MIYVKAADVSKGYGLMMMRKCEYRRNPGVKSDSTFIAQPAFVAEQRSACFGMF